MLHITRMTKVLLIVVLLMGALLLPAASSTASAGNSYNAAGVETFLGFPRTDGQEGRMGVRFRGWFVEGNGWQEASQGKGTVLVVINYVGVAKQGTVTIDGGEWRAWIPNDRGRLTFKSGSIQGGSVTWQNVNQCPATVDATLTGYFKAFHGYLDDCRPLLPTILPTIWGTFSG